jgi:hypothetical protein
LILPMPIRFGTVSLERRLLLPVGALRRFSEAFLKEDRLPRAEPKRRKLSLSTTVKSYANANDEPSRERQAWSLGSLKGRVGSGF